jgi:hypothetical protein
LFLNGNMFIEDHSPDESPVYPAVGQPFSSLKSSTGNVTNFIVNSKRQAIDTHRVNKDGSHRIGEIQRSSDEDFTAAFDEQSAVNNLLLEGEEAFDKVNIEDHMMMRLRTQQAFNIKGSSMKHITSNTRNQMFETPSAKSELLVKKQMVNPVLMQISISTKKVVKIPTFLSTPSIKCLNIASE